jgi:N-acetylmuramoyl-L-alanine amidase
MPAIRVIVLALGLVCAAVAVAGPVRVDAVRIATRADQTRVALDLSSPGEHAVFTLSNPDRIVIDLKSGRLNSTALPLPNGQGVVRRIRGANRDDGSVRVVLDLARPVEPKSFLVAANGRQSDRLVIDLGPGVLDAPLSPAPAEPSVPLLPSRSRDLVIAIDAGHGGKDPGARGPNGAREKDVVLQISRRLAAAIEAEPGMRAVLTRSGDAFVPLRTRMERARQAEADLFLSIHADAFRDRRVRGTTVYALSNKGASDEASRRLAERENEALVGGVSLADKDQMLASVLLDLSQNASLSASIDVGDQILAQIGQFGRLRKRSVQQAPFLVLKSPDVPSLLIETAFISNAEDERNLSSSQYQQRLAGAILGGVRDYFYANPPPGTMVAELARRDGGSSRQHVIRRGDTLGEIADRYKVSVRQIRAVNGLNNDRIRVGQVLTIPAASRT